MTVAVVGAGVVGLSVAVELAERGAEVVVLERDRVGAGTSSTTFAWVNSHRKEPDAYHELNAAGLRAYHAEAAGIGRWFFPAGHTEIATSAGHAADLARDLDRLAALGYPARVVGPAEARELEPGLRIPDGALQIVHYPQEGYCLPPVLLGRLVERLHAAGGTLRERYAVDRLDLVPGGVQVRAGADRLRADAVVTAAGRWTQELVATAGGGTAAVRGVPMLGTDGRDLPTLGFLGVSEPLPVDLRGVVTSEHLNLRPDGGGRVLVQALDLDAGATSAGPPPPEVAGELGRRLHALLRRPRPVRIDPVVVGRRAVPADGRTVAGWLDDGCRLYAVATHSGVTLARVLAGLVGTEVLGGSSAPLAAFRPDRFAAGAGLGPVEAPRSPGTQ